MLIVLALAEGLAGPLVAAPEVPSAVRPRASEAFADQLYRSAHYSLALLEYRRLTSDADTDAAQKARAGRKLALTQMQLGAYRGAMDSLPLDGQDFTGRYMRMYASLRLGLTQNALFERSRIMADQRTSPREAAETELLTGTVLLEKGRFSESKKHYRKLRKESEDPEIQRISTDVLTSLAAFMEQPRKRPWLAGTLSALLPGAGQWYAAHEADAISSFFFNAMFLGSAIGMYDLERQAGRPHTGSILFGIVGLIFYSANITGAIGSARRYNVYQERRFHQRIRDSFFNLQRVEKVSRLQFDKRF